MDDFDAGLEAGRALVAGQQLIERALSKPDPAKVVTAIHGETLRLLIVAAEEVLERTEERDYGRVHLRLQDAIDNVRAELKGK